MPTPAVIATSVEKGRDAQLDTQHVLSFDAGTPALTALGMVHGPATWFRRGSPSRPVLSTDSSYS